MKKEKFSLEQLHILKNGSTVLIRDLKKHDKKLLAEGLDHLSFKSRFYRFLSPIHRLTSSQLDYLTSVDQVNHFALGAKEVGVQSEKGIGVCRFIRENETQAEFSITIADQWQGLGLGSVFLKLLKEHARELGFHELVGYVHRDNLGMIALLERNGPYRLHPGSAVYKVFLEL